MRAEPLFRGTLRAFLAGAAMGYLYVLSEVRARDGRLLGHFLAIPEKIGMSYVTEDGTLFLLARGVRKG